MDVKVRAAPPCRGNKRPPRPPRYEVRARAEPEPSGRGVLLLMILVVAGAVAAWIVLREPAVDPHFASAKAMLAGYEDSRSAEQRNFNHPVYGEALDELALVDPASRSAPEAAELADSIRASVAAFQAKQRLLEDGYAAHRAHKRQVEERVFVAQERARLNPVVSYPECELEGKGGHSHSDGHKH